MNNEYVVEIVTINRERKVLAVQPFVYDGTYSIEQAQRKVLNELISRRDQAVREDNGAMRRELRRSIQSMFSDASSLRGTIGKIYVLSEYSIHGSRTKETAVALRIMPLQSKK